MSDFREGIKMTNKEMFIQFLSKTGVKYSENNNVIYIEDHIDDSPGRYGASLEVIFNDDESLKMFSPLGE